jgi:uncharacterized protein YcfL
MKTINFLTTVTAVAIVAIATAVEKPKMDVIPLTADRAIVSITNEKPALFEMSIETLNGDLVYYKQTTDASTQYQKIFDFANLEKGSYVLNLKVNDTKVTREFEVTSKNIHVGESKLRFDPYFSFKNDMLKFSYLNFDQENYQLYIYNSEGLVFQKKIGKAFAIQNGFDLSKLESGNYKVVLSSHSNNYAFSLVK